MDILNFINWVKEGRVVTSVTTPNALLVIGVQDARRDDKYLTVAMTVDDFIAQYGTGPIGLTGAQGPVGPTGSTGQTGPQGVPGIDGAVGPAGLNWQGLFVGGTSYILNDAVSYEGASYFCINPTTSTVTPDLNTGDWALLAAQGANGQQGIQGAPGVSGTTDGIKKLGVLAQNGAIITGGIATVDYISASILIPANTLETNSIISTSWGVYKSIAAGVVQSSVWVGPNSSNLTGATRIATGQNQTGIGIEYLRNERDFQKVSTNIYAYNPAQLAVNDMSNVVSSRGQITIDPTIDLYFHFCVFLTDITSSAAVGRIRMFEYY